MAVALSLVGVFVIVGGLRALDEPPSVADLAALIAGICYTAAGIANRKARRIPMISRTLSSFAGCAVLALAGLLISVPTIPDLPALTWLLLAGFAFFWLLGAGLLTTYGVTHVQASRAAVFQIVELLVAVVSAVLIGGEMLSFGDYVGGALILLATMIEALPRPLPSAES
jgi:drug/metabolite transporter (DMT)-like permease